MPEISLKPAPSARREAPSEDATKLSKELDLSTLEIQELRKELARAGAELSAVRRTLSWRLTAPLRLASGRLLGLRRRARHWRHKRLIAKSGLFDANWYRKQYPEVTKDPIWHYLDIGASGGRDPNFLFDSDWYLKEYPDVARARVNPLVHYLMHGAADGRNPHPLFNTRWYTSKYPDVRVSRQNPLAHFLKVGMHQRRKPNPYTEIEVDSVDAMSARFWEHDTKPGNDYRLWIREFAEGAAREQAATAARVEASAVHPKISILMPVFDTAPIWLNRAIASVRSQMYSNWQLCISDDASSDGGVRELLESHATQDARIVLNFREKRGHIAANSNSALAMADGEFVALLDADDELTEDALLYVADEVRRYPNADLIYSDEDKIDEANLPFDPYFKPDWNPGLMLSQNVFCHLGVYRRSLVDQVGGFRTGYEGSQDHDLVLRCSEYSDVSRIRHIPRVLYHWRAITGSSALQGATLSKPYAWASGARAISDHLKRQGLEGEVQFVEPQYYQVNYVGTDYPTVSLIMPSACKLNLLRPCLQNLLERTDYPDFQIFLAVNDIRLQKPDQKAYLDQIKNDKRVRVLIYKDTPFNFSWINNWAISQTSGPLLCLINDDVEAVRPNWLSALVTRVQLPGVGAAGPLLLYPNDTIQHAGVILGLGGVAGHPYVKFDRGTRGYFGRAALEQDLSCVTAACAVLRREAFEQVGGFDEQLAVAFNDVDLCIRLRRAGWRIIWTPAVELYHHESASIGRHDSADRRERFEMEVQWMRDRWGDVLDSDPFYNPNLSLSSFCSTLSFPPRTGRTQ